MFKLKKEANLKRNYFITSSRLKLLHLIIIIFSIFVLLGLIVSIRAPAFIQILCIVFGILAIYKINNKLKDFRYELDFDLIIRESLLFVLYTNHLYTSEKDNSGYEKIIRSAILKYELDNQNGHIIIKALIRGDEFSKKVQTLDDVLAGVLELELEEKITHPNIVEYHFYYKKPNRLILSP
ncbi:otitis media-associated H10, partial [Streptococcus pneumoniae]